MRASVEVGMGALGAAGVDPEALGVAVRWLPAATTTAEGLVAMGATGAGHACARCGSDEHGVPWARSPRGRLAASASRAAGHLVVATRAASDGAIGVDVEAADAVVDPGAVLHPDERDSSLATDLAWAWVAKEAIVKHRGTGLRTDPASIRVADFAVHRIPAPDGYVAALCLGATTRA